MSTATDTPAEVLRARMVERILAGQQLTPTVETAMRHVERHRYVPDVPVADAYDEKAVITHTFPDGTHLSCASVPSLVAAMLDALQAQPGHNILEIGAGTGYNAALLATLTGSSGQVVTLDINSDVTAAARRHLDDTGYSHVRVITRDGADGATEHGPYDRIIVTVGAWDIPHTWWDQLTPGGRLVVPLRWRGTTRAVAFTKTTDRWESDWVYLCGFVPMLGQPGEHASTIDPDGLVTLYYDLDQDVDTKALQGVLDQEKIEVWSDATVAGDEPFDGIWLRLSATDHRTLRIQADQKAIASGLCTPAIPTRTPALADGSSLAYQTIRRSTDEPGRWQIGATGHGPHGAQLAARIVEQVTAWDRDRTAVPALAAYATGRAPLADLTGNAIEKPETRLFLTYDT
ncbi:hypothetical protein Val02_90900 [Virgisporangium aliadipatigenens]|uniref:Protein-L-isoaspartate O-methyltransferase n=1 Tax=Virgisporangium aliadipatigenens TaxID=741659 RepID=A0A8J3YUL8_9ACTN|nr:methyltransferase, FxLD system [Virgisporangium aliadipatigenens]GIJ52204.1 hypothetical protein Val02_90900 [Virgisporangium aliadipatigenens]